MEDDFNINNRAEQEDSESYTPSEEDDGIYNISSTSFVGNNVIAVRKSKPIFIEKVSHSPHDALYTGINIQKYVLNSLPWQYNGNNSPFHRFR